MFSIVSLLGIIYFVIHFEIMFLSTILLQLLSSCLHLASNTFTEQAAWIPKTQNKADPAYDIKLSLHFPKCQLKNIPQQRLKLFSKLKTEIIQKQNSCLFPKSTILKLIQIKNVANDKAATMVWKSSNALKMEISYE